MSLRLIFISYCFFLCTVSSFAQHRTCATMNAFDNRLKSNTSTLNDVVTARTLKQAHQLPPLQRFINDTIFIPVVVHVVYRTSMQQISREQVESQIRILNEDYLKMSNTNGDNTHPVGANCKIAFVLAKRDPNNNPTDGITYTATNQTSFGFNDAVKFTNSGGINAWPRDSYLNIWVCNLGSGLLGYASFPGEPANVDGVVCDYAAFGDMGTASAPFDLGRTLTHEIGHWLGLLHTWGDDDTDSDPCLGSDYIDDTPNQELPTFGCPAPNVIVSCDNGPDGGDMYQNYMDYSDDACMNIFTIDQAAVMTDVLNTIREPIKQSQALDPLPLGVNEQKLLSLRMYPNPSTGSVIFDGVLSGENTVLVSDIIGNAIMKVKLKDSVNTFYLDEALPNGTYFLEIRNQNNSSKTFRLVLQR